MSDVIVAVDLALRLTGDARVQLSRRLYQQARHRGFEVRYVPLGDLGLSYYIEAPSGDCVVPTIGATGISLKPKAAVDHWTEGWIVPGDPTDNLGVVFVMAYKRWLESQSGETMLDWVPNAIMMLPSGEIDGNLRAGEIDGSSG